MSLDSLLIWWNDFFSLSNLYDLAFKLVAFIVVLAVSWIAFIVFKKYLLRGVKHFVENSNTNWDNILYENKFFDYICYLAPSVIIYLLAPVVFGIGSSASNLLQLVAKLYMILTGLFIINSFLNSVEDIFKSYEFFKKYPIRSFIQVAKVIAYFSVGIVILSVLIGQPPIYFIGSLGAMTAILLLIFKDSILGLVAGIQLTANKMLQIGDWIEMPAFGADGDVIEVNLTTVKVQNFDRTITTVPAYALISSSFKNWRGMQEAGGRRIMRSINIDISTIRFCTEDMIGKYLKYEVLKDYINKRQDEIEEYNKSHNIDGSQLVNGRRMTNIGVYRAYMVEYLKRHPKVHKDMLFLIRQLEPRRDGVPIQVYLFLNDTNWVNYETIQADIFDHLLAVVPHFDLRIFQDPTGADFARL